MAVHRPRHISLEQLMDDYRANDSSNEPFSHFYCPFLYKDEDSELCDGHIVNEAFGNEYSPTIKQRADVDNFYGAMFEADFVQLIRYKEKGIEHAFADKSMHSYMKPVIVVDGKEHQTYSIGKGHINPKDTAFEIEVDGKPHRFAAKGLNPDSLTDDAIQEVRMSVNRCITLESLVSLLKAAHLSLFFIWGYQYAKRSGSVFLGGDILGKFFRDNNGKAKEAVKHSAASFFRDYVNLVRPYEIVPDGLQATIEDNKFFEMVGSSGNPYAIGVVIRTGSSFHLVLVPHFENAEGPDTFFRFLKTQRDEILGRQLQWNPQLQQMDVKTRWMRFNWPIVEGETAFGVMPGIS